MIISMKMFVIPDIHLKPEIFKKAKEKLKAGEYGNVILLGDFVDDWGQAKNIELYKKTFDALDEFLSEYPRSLVCYGNHDLSYVWDKMESGYSGAASETVKTRIRELYKHHSIERFKYIHLIDNVLFSHAGLTKGFLMEKFRYDTDGSIEHIVQSVNQMGRDELWDNASPIWARPSDGYVYYSKGYLQVVGHTPVKKAYYDEEHNILMTDCFHESGNKRFVLVDTVTKEWDYA